ncbi:DUF2496 domain-containing protein [Vibrio cincinnatiensis]|jgi:hypothetical protein|uniref:Primosomal protein n=1 Tax=Vibrio cincinnatiensis DSM 19608 TaxID=1123491 RepID=A0A1T4K4Q7_VIBCI|nr:pleiotropic regulatory protein RsmS [Vibrio cincinnatiensis]MCG3723040.1 DUF2496 domain-containing protein [Vibrio cincinnatiensis]MCG3724225.1 DUF2496 domain-containing protein [Vibrio cincinnatiensis]MCG3733197.1 DUF2496 domain-containing protein [Vibrio cincinnatiensis]MCG3734882.1 DUF2496 domain-containing protein [Vibrio cincinnatiensis]MCG3740534.1 DUF2496 domain-containing protein [Vibrio cincinnatiensis]
MSHSPTSLDEAPDEIKLAVDLIYLLESNQVDLSVALKAIDLVKQDLENQLTQSISNPSS